MDRQDIMDEDVNWINLEQDNDISDSIKLGIF
jgi:hypothetical protein